MTGLVHACFSMVISDLFLFNLHYTNLLMIMTKAHNILSKVNRTILARSLIMVLNVS